jgi:hypothetical protein
MYNFKFDNRVELDTIQNLSEGLFIWIWQPHKLPPHLGISQNGKYFSLLYERKQEALSLKSQMDLIDRKKLSMIWQEITTASEDFAAIFEKYTSCTDNRSSCIQPILDGLGIEKNGGVLFDLLSELHDRNALGKVFSYNLPEGFKGIKKYSRQEVEMYLFKLQG